MFILKRLTIVALSGDDDKRVIMENGISTVAHGHYKILESTLTRSETAVVAQDKSIRPTECSRVIVLGLGLAYSSLCGGNF